MKDEGVIRQGPVFAHPTRRELLNLTERLLTVQELAASLQIKPRTVYQWVHESYIPFIKLGSLVRFSPARVLQWLEKREAPGRMRRKLSVDLS